jgi:hypothetical protein
MPTVDDEFLDRTKKFIGESTKAGEPFFAWYAPSRMHIYTHLRPGREKLAAPHSSELDVYGSGMVDMKNPPARIAWLLMPPWQ